MPTQGIVHGPLGERCLHLCVDMQRLFREGSPWAVRWFDRVLPPIEALCTHRPDRTLFTRFVPAERPGEGQGTWSRYYRRWESVTQARLGSDAIRLAPELERFAPPARVVDKRVYSPWTEGHLDRALEGSGIDTFIITGGETDVCVLATTLGAIDRGIRVILVTDALCSSSDRTHDAMMEVYFGRFGEQVETATAADVLKQWQSPPSAISRD